MLTMFLPSKSFKNRPGVQRVKHRMAIYRVKLLSTQCLFLPHRKDSSSCRIIWPGHWPCEEVERQNFAWTAKCCQVATFRQHTWLDSHPPVFVMLVWWVVVNRLLDRRTAARIKSSCAINVLSVLYLHVWFFFYVSWDDVKWLAKINNCSARATVHSTWILFSHTVWVHIYTKRNRE